jgi:hypothetical protein
VSCENNGLVEKLSERLLECENDLENRKDDLKTWTDSLEELSEIQDAFKTDGKFRIRGKKVLDIGTDCVKPLYIALKFKPNKIIGISEDLSIYSFEPDLKQKSKLFTETKIGLHNCSLFDNETLNRILRKEKIKKFDFVLVSKTLHHLRTGECIAKERDENHKHQKDETEKCCIYGFNEREIFDKLLKLGKRVIVYEAFSAQHKDNDNVRGRGGYFTPTELGRMFMYLSAKYKVEFIQPEPFHLDKETLDRVEPMLRQVDCICFYVEEQVVRNAEKL